eukprot:TRINITY_DN74581_c0_g1_i1.p1 TRINITY_DN74581_c0_g1~~TRINITY_DN74581_c0_g1_i1.p1  ORF type:complete len:446 (+),score=78.05 TRINITY_DN74581_c0_g1_i1:78-1415(+)
MASSMHDACSARRVELAATFLGHPAAQASEWADQKEFLLSKGVTEGELQEAHLLHLTGKAPSWPLRPLPLLELSVRAAAPRSTPSSTQPQPTSTGSDTASHAIRVSSDSESSSSTSSSSAMPSGAVSSGASQAVPKKTCVSTPAGSVKSSSQSCHTSDVRKSVAANPTPAKDSAESDDEDSSSSSSSSKKAAGASSTGTSTAVPTTAGSSTTVPSDVGKHLVLNSESAKFLTKRENVQEVSSSSSSSTSSSSGSASQKTPGSGKTAGSTVPRALPVVYRSDVELWPPGIEATPLFPDQRRQLRLLACDHGKRLAECMEDLNDVKAKAAEYRKACPGKQQLLDAGSVLEAEAERLRCNWREAVACISIPPSQVCARPLDSQGIRPQVVRGRRWYSACVEGMPRQLGPLRPSLKEAVADYELMRSTAPTSDPAVVQAQVGQKKRRKS